MSTTTIQRGFFLAGIMNIGGVLLFSRFLTNTALNQADPVVMSNFGLLSIILWGMIYIAVGLQTDRRLAAGVFALEKLLYVLAWSLWMSTAPVSLGDLFARDFLAGAFFLIYGPNDLLFCAFFAYVFFTGPRE